MLLLGEVVTVKVRDGADSPGPTRCRARVRLVASVVFDLEVAEVVFDRPFALGGLSGRLGKILPISPTLGVHVATPWHFSRLSWLQLSPVSLLRVHSPPRCQVHAAAVAASGALARAPRDRARRVTTVRPFTANVPGTAARSGERWGPLRRGL